MSYLTRQDVVQSGLDYLIDFWKDKPIIRGILTSQLKEIQILEDAAYQLLTERSVTVAIGAQLDVIGSIVGEQRLGKRR